MTYQILDLIIQIILLVIGGLLIPMIKNEIGESKYRQLLTVVDIGVAAAEQIYKTMPKGEEKNLLRYQHVANYLTNKGLKINETELKTLIEGAVLRLNEAVQ